MACCRSTGKYRKRGIHAAKQSGLEKILRLGCGKNRLEQLAASRAQYDETRTAMVADNREGSCRMRQRLTNLRKFP